MSDASEEERLSAIAPVEAKETGGPLATACFVIGGAALLIAMMTDFVSVATRHLGLRIFGAIEIVQYCIVAAISTALVIATASGAHAAVHLVTERVGPRARQVMGRFSDWLASLCFGGLLAGDVWLAIDVWSRDERSDLLHLPIAPARAVWCLSLALALTIALTNALRPLKRDTQLDA